MNIETSLKPLKDNRHLFERQKYIQDAVEAKIVQFCEKLNSYTVGWHQGDSTTLGFVNGAWFQWLEQQKQLKDHILIPKQPDNIMIAKIAESRILRPNLGKDNILYELQHQSFVESYEAEKLRLHRDYQAFVQAQEKLND